VNQSSPKPTKTDQEILEELKQASSGERRRGAGLTAFVILLAIVIGVFMVVNRRADQQANSDANNVAVATENNTANVDNTNTAESNTDSVDNASQDVSNVAANVTSSDSGEATGELPTEQSSMQDNNFVEVTQTGEGVTHLARRATRAYLDREGINDLTAAHKIFIEDYLAQQSGKQLLEIGESRSFSTDMLNDAVTQARALTATDLQNLQRWTVLVPGL